MHRRTLIAVSALASCVAALDTAHAAHLLAADAPAARISAIAFAEDLAAAPLPDKAFAAALTSKKPPAAQTPFFDYFDLAISPAQKGIQPNAVLVDLRDIIGGEERPEVPVAAEVPAPGALILMLTGLAAFAGARKRG